MSELDRVEIAKWNLQEINSWIKNADAKIAVAMTFQVGLIVVFVAEIKEIIKIFTSTSITFVQIISLIFLSFFVYNLHKSIINIFAALYPDIDVRGRSLFFFGNITKIDKEKFKALFSTSSIKELQDDLLNQVYINASIATRKFTSLRSGIQSAAWAFFFLILAVIIISL